MPSKESALIPSPSANSRPWLAPHQNQRCACFSHPDPPLPIGTRLIHTNVQQSYYDFRYDDEDHVLNEIEEFYSYVEMPQVAENLKAWEGSFPGGACMRSHICGMP